MATAKKSAKAGKQKGKKLSMEQRFPMTISLDLFNTWQKLRRKGDPALLCDELHLSRPVIDRAVNYGHVKNENTAELISKFFKDRLQAEKNNPTPPLGRQSKKLVELAK